MAGFKKFLHVERLSTPECEGILNNPVVFVTSKMDGSCASVWWDNENERIACGSRTRELTAEKDNAGFYAWVHGHNEEAVLLREFVTLHPHLVIYGEWMGHSKFIGSIKDYEPEVLGQMWIFDVYNTTLGRYLSDDEWRPLLAEYGLSIWFTYLLDVIDHPTMEDIERIAQNNNFMLYNAPHKGEGVVVKAKNWINKYGEVAYGKLVLDEYKASKARKKKNDITNPEEYVVENYVTDAEISKSIAKGCALFEVDTFDKKDGRQIGFLLSTVWRDAVLAETGNWVKKLKNPIIDFNLLKIKTDEKIKNYIGL